VIQRPTVTDRRTRTAVCHVIDWSVTDTRSRFFFFFFGPAQVVLNNFKGAEENIKLMSVIFQKMFSPINIKKVPRPHQPSPSSHANWRGRTRTNR
jgi:hypothetical protein